MSGGHWGKGLRVNLTTGEIKIEELAETWLRRYLGGWGFISYYLLKELEPGIDPLGPENLLIYATGPMAGQPLAGGGRIQIGCKSPLSGGFCGSEAGGYFGAELKRSGWDLIIFEGVSPKPVYLWINDDKVELRSAENLWGLETYDTEEAIREELGDKRIRVSEIGPAGENKVLVSNVMHDATRAAGRGGAGAVMGSKNLKAVAVRGSQRPVVADMENLTALGRWFAKNFKETGSAAFNGPGTNRMVRVNQTVGGLPTRNFSEGVMDTFEKISSETMQEEIVERRDTCFGCPVRCKWMVKVDDDEHPVDPKYGGPEYETVGSLGSVCGIDDLNMIAYGNQLCNANGLDTIGTGVTIAFAMECFEREIISVEDTEGIELRFGNAEAMVTMIEKIIKREGFGNVLANGSRKAAEIIGQDSLQYTVQIKGQEVAMHDPRVKYGHGLGDAVSPTGADHMHNVHDSGYQNEAGIADLMPLGVYEPLPYDDLSPAKAQMVRRALIWRVHYNLTGICYFQAWSTLQTVDLIRYVTGWNTSVMEIWSACERAYDMARAFNAREGFGPDDDLLPPRLFEKQPSGPVAGKVYSMEEFLNCREAFYRQMGWDAATACPTRGKLEDLDVAWVADLLEKADV